MSTTAATAAASGTMLADYIDGLKDAHALEKSATQLLERQLERLESYPEVAAVLRRHLGETRVQIERLDEMLASLDQQRSWFKDLATSLTGNMAALGHAATGDEVLKNHFANHAFENFEIASYLSLIAMAEETGRHDHVVGLRHSLAEEESTVRLLRDMTPDLTRKYLARHAAGVRADR